MKALLAAALARPRLSAWSLAGLAFALRLLAVVHGGRFALPANEWERGYEVGAVAAAIATGRGFADPFRDPTGSTAAVGPLVPALWSVPLRVLGSDNPWAWRAIILLDIVALALVVPVLASVGRRLRGPAFGLLCALAWAVHPLGVMLARGYLGSLGWYALAVTIVLDRMLAMEQGGSGSRNRAAIALGLALGASSWIEPLLLPFAGLWFIRWIVTRRELRAARLAAGIAVLMILPWLARNAVVLGIPATSSSAGPELWLGALAGPGEPTPIRVHPSRNRIELERLREIGESRFAREKLALAGELIARDPARWAAACAFRLGTFWLGRPSWWSASPRHPVVSGSLSALRGLVHGGLAVLAAAGLVAAWRSVPATRTLALLFAVYPVTYALTHVEARYRLPIEPMLCVAACLLVARWRAPRASRMME